MKINFRFVLVFILEFVATLLNVAVGCMGGIGKDPDKDSGVIAVHKGLVTMIVVHCFGYLTGALTNPSISFACWSYGLIKWRMLLVYIAAQFGGAFAGYYLLTVMLPESMVTGAALCVTRPNSELSDIQIFAVEFFLTVLMVFGLSAILDVSNKPDVIPFRFGGIIAVCCTAGTSLTGAGLNCARIYAAAYFNSNFEKIEIYCCSHFLAGFLAPYFWKMLLSPKQCILKDMAQKAPSCSRQY